MMEKLISISPLKVLERSSQKGLGKGNLGVIIARAGVGKTVCLIHLALNNIFKQNKLIHVSLEENAEKVMSYYHVMYSDLVGRLNIPQDDEYRSRIDRDRKILAYRNKSFDTERLRASINNLANELNFRPHTLIVDGLDFENAQRGLFERFRDIAQEFGMEVWFSARSHRHITETNERGIPYPCQQVDDLFSIILHLETGPSGAFMKLLKDHEHPSITHICVRVDPATFLSID
jgi:hypothetical protein